MTRNNTDPHPTDLRLRKTSRLLEVRFSDGAFFQLPLEYLRVNSPSAEVRGHGPGQEVLQKGKERVAVTQITPVGQYAVRLGFDDGHNSGLYTWKYLYELGQTYPTRWQEYLDRLKADGYQRNPPDAGAPS